MPNVTVELRGPFFKKSLPGEVDKMMRGAIAEIVNEGERDVAKQLYPGHGLITGHYRRSIHGDVLSSRNGVIHDSKVIYGPWLEGVSSRNRSTRFKGYSMFRNAFQRLQRKAPGIFRKHVSRMVKGLN